MAKIGILNFAGHCNHGANLTAYALQRTLEGMGHEARNLILHCNPHDFKDTNFTGFAEAHLKVDAAGAYGEAGMARFNEGYDTFIVGSDQVWRHGGWKWKEKFDGCFWLRFAAPGKRRIAMAASFGGDAITRAPEGVKEAFAAELRKYTAISVREDFGCKFIPELSGQEAIRLLDPVFMLSAREWEEVMAPAPERKRPVVAFNAFLGAQAFQEEIAPAYGGYDVVNLVSIPTAEWLRTIRDAELVISNSFHVCCFSLIFGTPLAIMVGNPKIPEDRLYQLAEEFGLAKERLVNCQGGKEEIIAALQRAKAAPYDAAAIRATAEKGAARAKQWLEQALAAPPVEWEGAYKAPGMVACMREKLGSKRWRLLLKHKALRAIARMLHCVSPVARRRLAARAEWEEARIHSVTW